HPPAMISIIPLASTTTQAGSVKAKSAIRTLRLATARACAPPKAARRLRQNGAMNRLPSSTTTASMCTTLISHSQPIVSPLCLERLTLTATSAFQRLFTLAQFDAADLAANGLGQFGDEGDLTRVFLWCSDALDVFLEFLHQRG